MRLPIVPSLVLFVCAPLVFFSIALADEPDPPTPFPQPAFTAEQFVDFIGLNAGPFDKYLSDGPFKGAGTKYPPEMFFDLGVRYYRMCLKYDLTPADAPDKVKAAFVKYGARPMMLIDPGKDGTPLQIVDRLKQYGGSEVVAAVEGPNEVNNKFPPQELNLKYAGKHDEAAGAAYMADLYKAIKADPATRDIPVVNYTAIFTDYSLARPCDAFDFNSSHSYQGQGVPSSSLLKNFISANHILPVGGVIKPFVPTECGYNIEQDVSNQIKGNGSERSQALNIPMLLAEYFRHGYMRRAYLFALQNADGYGLLESGQQIRRPSYFALQSLMASLKDANWNPESRKWEGGQFRPRALLFTVDDAPPTLKEITVQKASGEYSLLLWNELENFDSGGKRERINPSAHVTLHFSSPVSGQATVLRQDDSGAFAPAESLQLQNDAISINVPSSLIMVHLPGQIGSDSAAAAPPQNVRADATENSVHLQWYASENNAGFFIFRNGWCVQSTTDTQWDDRSPWLRPGLGYTYEVEAYDKAGNMSARVPIIVQTAAKFPNLIVTDFGMEKEKVQPGERVHFRARVKNVGDGATPYGVTVSDSFSVDGHFMCWGGEEGPLAPGDEREMITNGGPHGTPLWTATAGSHLLSVHIDDIDRMPEVTSKNDAIRARTIIIGDPPTGELIGSSSSAPWKVDLTAEGTEDWVHWGLKDVDSIDRKAGVEPAISNITKLGNGFMSTTGGFAVRSVWSDGLPTGSVDATNTSLWVNGVGSGYSFTLPASPDERIARIYTQGIEGAACSLTAALSDASAPAYIDKTWTGNFGQGSWAPVPGEFTAVYEIRYRAASAGQTLKIEFKLDAEANRFLGQARLGAVTLGRGN